MSTATKAMVATVAAAAGAERVVTGNRRAMGGRVSRRRATAGAAVAMADASVEVSKVEDKWIGGSLERCATGTIPSTKATAKLFYLHSTQNESKS